VERGRFGSSGEHSKPPGTPVVQDKDLTDGDMAVVSKYFKRKSTDPRLLQHQQGKQSTLSPFPRHHHSSGRHQDGCMSPHTPSNGLSGGLSRSRSRSPAPRVSVRTTPAIKGVTGDRNSPHPDPRPGAGAGAGLDPDPDRFVSSAMSTGVGVGGGGDEGLLDWCTHLDLDGIDSMY
jgi:hypothetical protein